VSSNISHAFLNTGCVVCGVSPISRHKISRNTKFKVRLKHFEFIFDFEEALNIILTQTLRRDSVKAIIPTYNMASCGIVGGYSGN